MLRRVLAFAVFMALVGPMLTPLPARADPILTPLATAALTGAGLSAEAGITIFSTTITYASLVTYTLTAGPVLYPSRIEAQP